MVFLSLFFVPQNGGEETKKGEKMKNEIESSKNDIKTANNFYLLDADLLPLMGKAENGCYYAQIDLLHAFTYGNGAKRDRQLEKKYAEMVYESTEDSLMKLAVLWNLAVREKELGNHELMKAKFEEAIRFKVENLPVDKWDFNMFLWMEKHIYGSDE